MDLRLRGLRRSCDCQQVPRTFQTRFRCSLNNWEDPRDECGLVIRPTEEKSLLAAGVGLRPGHVSKYGYQNPKGLKHNNVNIACKLRNLVVTQYVSMPKL